MKFFHKPKPKGLNGWKPDTPDRRDLYYTRMGKKKALPNFVDLRNWFSLIENQGQIGSCFHPDTKIPLLNGQEKTIKELYDNKEKFWVYSINEDKKIVPGLAEAKLTGKNKTLLKIILDNNQEIICTPDHKFLLRDGKYIEANNLQIDNSLMPLYRKIDKKGYELTFSLDDNKYHYTHNLSAYSFNKDLSYISEKIKCVHHKDFNKLNNDPLNLQIMGLNEHFEYHQTAATSGFRSWNGTEKKKEWARNRIKKQYEENPEWNREAMSKGGKAAQITFQKNPELLKPWLEAGHSKESRKKAIENSKKTRSTNEWKEKASEREKKKDHTSFIKAGRKNIGGNAIYFKILKSAKIVYEKYNEINEHNWNEERKNHGYGMFPLFNTVIKYYNSVEQLEQKVRPYNHKIIKIEELNYTSDVYCLTVEKYHNFALSAGVFVHNCTGNAIVGILEYLENKEKKTFEDFSRLFVYYNERMIEGTIEEDAGAMIRTGIKTLKEYGVCSEKLWPYVEKKFTKKPDKKCYDDALNHTISQYKRLETFEDMQNCLAEGFPFVCGISLYDSFDSDEVTKTGIVPMPGDNESCNGGHAVVCCGYNNSDKRFLMRNSWGSDWGIRGYFTIPYDYLTNSDLACDFWMISKMELDK